MRCGPVARPTVDHPDGSAAREQPPPRDAAHWRGTGCPSATPRVVTGETRGSRGVSVTSSSSCNLTPGTGGAPRATCCAPPCDQRLSPQTPSGVPVTAVSRGTGSAWYQPDRQPSQPGRRSRTTGIQCAVRPGLGGARPQRVRGTAHDRCASEVAARGPRLFCERRTSELVGGLWWTWRMAGSTGRHGRPVR